jgi:phenylpropionate dioxygenase-like ring-hydroxylating dioxygenase large terminal subunit
MSLPRMDAPVDAAAREPRFPKWAAALTDQNAFDQERARLGRFWTFLGFTQDVPKQGDWITAELGGRSVFVQRFGEKLKGFENRCAHRFYPLRTEPKGNGKIKCGFHHWTYNQEGRAIHIPRCEQFYGVKVEEMNARIAPIEVATCGSLIFGRFQHPHNKETLAEYLGVGATIIEGLCRKDAGLRLITLDVAANWKLLFQISLDDYHSPAVHPTTFGVAGYLPREAIRYFRFGLHHTFFPSAEEDALQKMVAGMKDGTFRPIRYRIFQFFPNLVVALFRGQHHVEGKPDTHWYVNIQHMHGVAPGRTIFRSWFFRTHYDMGRGPLGRFWVTASEPIRRAIIDRQLRQIHAEDGGAVVRLQQFAAQQSGWPRLGYAEERIKWFEEAYAQALAD